MFEVFEVEVCEATRPSGSKPPEFAHQTGRTRSPGGAREDFCRLNGKTSSLVAEGTISETCRVGFWYRNR